MSNLENIRKKLINRKQELEALLSDTYRVGPQDQAFDTGDQALSSSLEDIKISLHNSELDEYKRVIKALEMIDDGSYGICIECGKQISEKRLALFPNSTRCLSCQEELEEKQS